MGKTEGAPDNQHYVRTVCDSAASVNGAVERQELYECESDF